MRKSPEPRPASLIPLPGEGMRGSDGHLGYLLRQAVNALNLAMERALADLGVTPPQFAVLTMLGAYPGASGADVARLVMQTPQTVSVIIANLERSGAVARSAHAVHGRIRHVDLTASGRALLARCRERVQALEKRLLAGVSTRDEAAIRAWLVALAVEFAPA